MKILLISHNPITDYEAMGKTFLSLFSVIEKCEICQFYIYPSLPNVIKCSSYYRITDKDVLKSYFKFKINGREILESEIDNAQSTLFENSADELLYRNRKNHNPIRTLLRDYMWKFSRWFNKGLKEWIEKENPTHIFVAPGPQRFLYDIALKVSKKYGLPIVTYICDDYYFVKKPKGLLERIKVKKLQRKTEQLMKKTNAIISICDEISMCYQKRFSVPSTTIMTGSNYSIAEEIKVVENPTSLTYLGNIRYNRYVSLQEMGKALDQINSEDNKNYKLKIYTAEKDVGIIDGFKNINSIELCGFVSGEEFEKTFRASEILVHTESFDERCIDYVKHSVSTKIADSLGSGICLFAYGPSQVASMSHLIENDCAIIATDASDLKNVLDNLFNNKLERERVAKTALKVAKENHDSLTNGQRVLKIFSEK